MTPYRFLCDPVLHDDLSGGPHSLQGALGGREQLAYEFTSQFSFQEERTNAVFRQVPYNDRGTRDTRNGDDGIYGESDGQTLMAISETDDGYEGTFTIALHIG